MYTSRATITGSSGRDVRSMLKASVEVGEQTGVPVPHQPATRSSTCLSATVQRGLRVSDLVEQG